MNPNNDKIHPSSFRDPSGYVFTKNHEVYRKINSVYFHAYTTFIKSGLYDELTKQKLIIPHTETEKTDSFIIIKPENIPFISYPSEWSFEQFKDAALLTLKIQQIALKYGMTLKDATAFNVTFHRNSPVFIDTLSFEIYKENTPWHAYSQFLSHFLGPLLLVQSIGCDFLKTLSFYINGIPLKDVWSMLPLKRKMSLFTYSNICLPAQFIEKYNNLGPAQTKEGSLSKNSLENIITNLYDNISSLKIKEKTEWSAYYSMDEYEQQYLKNKTLIIKEWIKKTGIHTIWDVGGNNGEVARSVRDIVETLIVSDIDPMAVNYNYLTTKKDHDEKIIPIVSDFLNSTPNRGFALEERVSFFDRIKAFSPDMIMALALLHHISLTGNIPFHKSAKLFHSMSDLLIIEFPHRQDPRVSQLLNNKREFKSLFDFYRKENFEKEYSRFFSISEKAEPSKTRSLYLLKKKVL